MLLTLAMLTPTPFLTTAVAMFCLMAIWQRRLMARLPLSTTILRLSELQITSTPLLLLNSTLRLNAFSCLVVTFGICKSTATTSSTSYPRSVLHSSTMLMITSDTAAFMPLAAHFWIASGGLLLSPTSGGTSKPVTSASYAKLHTSASLPLLLSQRPSSTRFTLTPCSCLRLLAFTIWCRLAARSQLGPSGVRYRWRPATLLALSFLRRSSAAGVLSRRL